jgi:formamidopyrimidine-DNA glycosylase
MPELPDVEGFRRFLSRHATGRTIERIEVLDPKLVRNRTPRSLHNALTGTRFREPRRHGKWLIAPCARESFQEADGVELLMHFGMTGALSWSDVGAPRHRHDRLVFVCQGGELRYNNMRRFGGVWLAADASERAAITGPLGPDAAALTLDQFLALTGRRRGAIKAALMDQFLVAGLGNLMCDEIMWRARVHPATPVSALSLARRRRVFEQLRAVVGESTRYGRVPHGGRWLTRVRDDRGAVCPRCGTGLRWARIAGRTTCWCPRCQRRGSG